MNKKRVEQKLHWNIEKQLLITTNRKWGVKRTVTISVRKNQGNQN